MKRTLTAVAELMRLSNSPTVVSNVIAGACLAGAFDGPSPRAVPALPTLALAAATALLLYTGGMIMNDVADARIDRIERPGRPIPSGRISLRTAAILSSICFGIAWGLARCTSESAAFVALGIAVLALLYDFTHTRTRCSVALLGFCRAGLYILAAAAFSETSSGANADVPWAVLIGGAGLGIFIVGFSLIARHEAQRGARASLGAGAAITLLAVAAATLPILMERPPQWPRERSLMMALALGALLLAQTRAAFTARRGRIGPAVMQWIASISLIDATLAAAFGPPAAAGACIACWLLTLAGHRRIAGS